MERERERKRKCKGTQKEMQEGTEPIYYYYNNSLL